MNSKFGLSEEVLETLYPLMEELDDLLLPYKFDVSIFENIDNPALREHIQRAGKILYQRK